MYEDEGGLAMMAVARNGRCGRSGSGCVHAGHVLSTICVNCSSCTLQGMQVGMHK